MEYNITIQHKAKKLNFSNVADSSSLKELSTRIQDETSIPPSLQKLIYKGKKLPLTKQPDEPLSQFLKSAKKVKMTLIGSTTNDIISSTTVGASRSRSSSSSPSPENSDSDSSKSKSKHQPTLDRIAPKFKDDKLKSDHVPGDSTKNEPLPKSIHVYNDDAELVRLVFHVDKRELWIASPKETTKVSFDSVRNVHVESIPQEEGYSIVGFQIGNNPEKDISWFFYVPKQFEKSIRYTLLGNLSFPFLHSSSSQ